TNYNFLKNATSFIIFLMAILILMYTIPEFRALGTTLFAGAGILAAIIGFASQQAFSNIVGGVFIVMFKPFRVGDMIEVGTLLGTVENINLRHTMIKDFQNKRIIIPNSTISAETIVNNHIEDERIRRRIELRVALDADIERAMEIIIDEIKKHPNYLDGRTPEEIEEDTPAVIVRVTLVGEYFINLMTYAWAENPGKAFEMHCDVNKSILIRFRQEGVEVPVPYRAIINKGQNG
ncbi:MAG: mechanosensitive ion channel family protein, partial [Flammeovirgaceae bacterium]